MKIGIIGLGRMGFSLALNARDHGHDVVVFNRTLEKVKEAENYPVLPTIRRLKVQMTFNG